MRRLISSRFVPVMAILIAILLIIIGALVWLRHLHPLPKSIRQQVNYLVFYPASDSGVAVDKSSFKYDAAQKVLSYTVSTQNRTLTVSEQPTPDAFNDVPQAYDKLVQSLGEYGSFDSLFGKVSLTRPQQLHGQQSAVMNAKGTLLFAHPTQGELSDDEWRQLFNSLRVVK
jgi:hypothetical protein